MNLTSAFPRFEDSGSVPSFHIHPLMNPFIHDPVFNVIYPMTLFRFFPRFSYPESIPQLSCYPITVPSPTPFIQNPVFNVIYYLIPSSIFSSRILTSMWYIPWSCLQSSHAFQTLHQLPNFHDHPVTKSSHPFHGQQTTRCDIFHNLLSSTSPRFPDSGPVPSFHIHPWLCFQYDISHDFIFNGSMFSRLWTPFPAFISTHSWTQATIPQSANHLSTQTPIPQIGKPQNVLPPRTESPGDN